MISKGIETSSTNRESNRQNLMANVSTRLSSARAHQRPPQAPKPNNQIGPVKHEPCSKTLSTFHDAVNSSLIHEYRHEPSSAKSSHRILSAKDKYKYMAKQKTYVDESLFGSTTPRPWSASNSRNELNRLTSGSSHLSHHLMSNMTPLIVNSPIPTAQNTARSTARGTETARTTNLNLFTQSEENLSVQRSEKRPLQKPWRP